MSVDGSPPDLHDLIRRARQGDDEALGKILEDHRDWLRIAAERGLDGELAARIDASDIVQQTFLSACNQIGQFQGGTSGELAAWLGKIQERNLQDAVRQHTGAGKRSVRREEGMEHEAIVGEISTPSRQVMRRERTSRISQALDRLPEDQREAVRLRHLEGRSLEQIAQQLGRSKVAVASLLKRGVENLRNQVQEDK